MIRSAVPVLLLGAVGLSACATGPVTGPSFAAMPGPGKSYEQFTADDAHCRQTAFYTTGGGNPQAAGNDAVGTAAAGTVLGAAAGALLGAAAGNAGIGAAAGAGTGLLVGSAAGADAAGRSVGGSQRSFDVVYGQCMAAAGEVVPNLNAGYAAYPAYAYPAYAYPPPVAYAPPISLGFFWGGGYHHGYYHGGYWH